VKVLLDTATVIAAIQGRLPVVLRLSRLKPAEVAVSATSRMEAEMALRLTPKANARFARLLKDFFASVKVLDFTAEEAAQAVQLAPYLPQGAEALKTTELQLAATALRHQLTLVTASPQRFAFIPNLEAERWA
jgi:tRNA(fMet)-specific endonuclease VapC